MTRAKRRVGIAPLVLAVFGPIALVDDLQPWVDRALEWLGQRPQGTRLRRVIELRFGLEDGHSLTLEEVGRDFGVTRSRIGQLEAKALRTLRHPSCPLRGAIRRKEA